ncbi:MAG: nucleotidyltransferase family protein [Paludibacteraceae bacterium]|nr:nucleotidyltransferase family protein [Paludibacteraceae bacterium]
MDLVRAALQGDKAVWPVEQTNRLMQLNAQQSTSTLVYPMVLEQTDIPASVRLQMKSMCLQTMQQQVKLQHTLQVALDALEKAGIQAVLMKGAGLAMLYPEPQYRTWGDIDLFVGKEQYHPACAVMRSTFPDALKFDEELDHYKHYNLIADGISIEIHRISVAQQHPVDEMRYDQIEHFGMTHGERITLNGLTVTVPEPTFNALFVLLHAWEHMLTQGANIRQLCDWVLLLRSYHDTIDSERLKSYLNALHLMDVWQLFTWLAVHHLGLKPEEALFYSDEPAHRADRLLSDLLLGQMVEIKHSDTAPKGRIRRKMHTMQERMKNADRIEQYSPAYARHMRATTWLHGARRFFAKDRHWE